MWYDKLWQNTVDLFRSLDIPVRTLECCSGDLADLEGEVRATWRRGPQDRRSTLRWEAAPTWAMLRRAV